MESNNKEAYSNDETFSNEGFVEFTLEALPGDTVFPGRERKGRPPIPEWMKAVKPAEKKSEEKKS